MARLQQERVRPPLIWLALAAVYLVWGSTYLAIRVAIQTLPPFLMAGVRFIVAGSVLYLWARLRGDARGEPVRRVHWVAAFIVGGALLLGGNGGVVWAEQHVESGLTALIIATAPMWMVGIDRVAYKENLEPQAVAGIAIGFVGLVLLIWPFGAGRVDPAGAAVLVFAAFSWSAGSLYSRRASLPAKPRLSTSMQMLAGGVLLGAAGLVAGEPAKLDLAGVSMESAAAFVYLILFGSLVGFSAYVWLLKVAKTSLVSTYAYVNPVVAVILGKLILDEAVTPRMIAAGAVILFGVALIVIAGRPENVEPAGGPADAAPPQKDSDPG